MSGESREALIDYKAVAHGLVASSSLGIYERIESCLRAAHAAGQREALSETATLRAENANLRQSCDDRGVALEKAEAERDAALAEVERMKALLAEAKEFVPYGTPESLLSRIEFYLRRPAPAAEVRP